MTKTTEALREPAESAVRVRARRAGRRRHAGAAAEVAALALGGPDLRDGRHARRRHGHLAEVRRQPAAHRDRRRDARDGPRAAAPGRPGHGQELGERAHRGRHQRRFHAARAGDRRHAGGSDPLRLELRAAPRQGPVARRGGAEPRHARDDHGQDRPRRGADARAERRAGHAHHDPLREDAARARAQQRDPRRSRASTSSRRPTIATRASTSCRARSNAASTPWSCRSPTPWRKRSRSSSGASCSSAARSSCRPTCPPSTKSAASSPSSASCAKARRRTARASSNSRRAR